MRAIFRFLLLCILCLPTATHAQPLPVAKTPRILFLLDGSSSMSEDWIAGRSRFQQAGKFIMTLVDSFSAANNQVEFGLRVFGHQYPAQEKNCYDTKREVMFARSNSTQMAARLESLHGYGVSPIAFSLSEAAYEDFENESKYAYSIILVTDGGESCGGDICKVANELLRRKIFFRPYIVSLVDYAPLKDLYKCLGSYMTVSNEADVPKVANTIVDAHREGFERAQTGTVIPVIDIPKKADTIVIPITVKKEEPKKPEPVPVKKDTSVAPTPIKKKELPTPVADTPKVPKIVPQIRDRRIIKPLKLQTKLKTYKTITIEYPIPSRLPMPDFVQSKVGDEPQPVIEKPIVPARKTEMAKGIKLAKRKPISPKLIVLPSPQKLAIAPFVQTAYEVVPEPPKPPVVQPIIKPIIKPSEKPIVKTPKENAFVVQTKPATETQVEVYFTDGDGKFFATTPQILLSDPNTGKPVHQFYRTVNPDGNPDPIKIPSGTFNLSVVGSDKTFLKSVEVTPNMLNKIIITVSNGSLQFVWKGGKNKKPVDKYFAVVKRNFVPQPIVKQRCDTVLPHPPGNYHIEINTLPVSVRSTDLSFGATVVIPIDEPGTIQITNTNDLGKVNFFAPRGDKYMQFYQMNISGNPALQSLEVLPGIYEVHFNLAPGLPEKVLTFHIRSNETTNIELQ
jgi:hypothetical protein